MAAQNLHEVMTKILNTQGTQLAIAFKGEIRDYLSHQVMRFQVELIESGASQEYQDVAEQVLLNFFERVMK